MKFDDLFALHVGHKGRYQIFLWVALGCGAATSTFFTIAIVFVGGTGQDYRCANFGGISSNNASSVLFSVKANGSSSVNKCTSRVEQFDAYTRNGSDGSSNQTIACDAWIYDRESQYESSLRTQYDLTCNKELFIPLTQSVYMGGWLVGCLIFGSLSDRYGRMLMISIGHFVQTVVGLTIAFIPNYYAALSFRFLLGISSGGTNLVCIVLCTEFCGRRSRALVGCLIHWGWNASLMLAAMVAYILEPVNHITLQLIFGASPIVFLVLRWVVPESPRWLVTQGRFDEARYIIKKIARLNGRPITDEDITFEEEKLAYSSDDNIIEKNTYTPLDLFRTPNIRRISLASFLIWFSASFIYYGFLFIAKGIGANVYINTAISGAAGVVASVVSYPLINYFGRRSTLFVMQAIMAASLIVSSFMVGNDDLEIAIITIITIGKFTNILVFDVLYLHGAEMYPTCIRSLGLGSGSLMARVAALIAPLVANLALVWPRLPIVVFAVISVFATLAELLLPETLGRPLPESISDGEIFARLTLKGFCPRLRRRQSVKKYVGGEIETTGLTERLSNGNHQPID